MKTTSIQAQAIHLSDYQAPNFLIDTVDLTFDLFEDASIVTAEMTLHANASSNDHSQLKLNGDEVELVSITIDGKLLGKNAYQLTDEYLIILNPPQSFNCMIKTRLNPKANTQLSGLYQSSSNFCTQCEAHGFRRITFFQDRPDVLARYTTTIIADKQKYPVLLSNGNLIKKGEKENNRHWVTWEDPFKKPCYLFALVAGDLAKVSDTFNTMSGRIINLNIYVEHGNEDKCAHAMASLKNAMRWDEENYGREYDLDIFNIVAVSDFNMGAMENKGLNIFNAKYILAKPETATDNDYLGIEGVVAHEYFHNWTGNRITCRDWFQLSLKEGLTVFRDQEFSRDMNSRDVNRIQDVQILRSHQFAEDSGPTAHPVRPESYIEVDNFYTMTVYNKGAEVIRMMQTLLGTEGFRKGMDLYFSKHDGSAVTIEDFVKAMEDANNFDLKQFRLWYQQAGTPTVTISKKYDPALQHLYLHITQQTLGTPEQDKKHPFHIPLSIALVNQVGQVSHQQILSLTDEQQDFTICDVSSNALISVPRDFSAPIRVHIDYSDAELIYLLQHDDNGFAKWEAGQRLAKRYLIKLIKAYQNNTTIDLPSNLINAYKTILLNIELDENLTAELLSIPSESYLASEMEEIDVEAIHIARNNYRQQLASALSNELQACYRHNEQVKESTVGQRTLKNTCLSLLSTLTQLQYQTLAYNQFKHASNMTDAMAAFSVLSHQDCPQRLDSIEQFYKQWQQDDLVLDKWFSVQASSQLADTLSQVKKLMHHEKFTLKNPNKIRALIGTFANANPIRFHAQDGSGYRFLTEQVKQLDKTNPQIAARLLTPMTRWRKYKKENQLLMKAQLNELFAIETLSKDVYEIVVKSLAN